jgi:hypothetical protein
MAARVRAKAYGGHCDAYRWLRDHYNRVQAMLSESRPSWRTMAEAIDAAGVVGARGQRLSPNKLREMWGRVTRDVAIAAAEKRFGVAPRKQPRDLPKNWAAQPTVPAVRAEQSPGQGEVVTESSFTRVKREMDAISGRAPMRSR